jgi:hypothetical protein
MAFSIQFGQKIDGVQFPNMTSPVTVKKAWGNKFWFDNSEIK